MMTSMNKTKEIQWKNSVCDYDDDGEDDGKKKTLFILLHKCFNKMLQMTGHVCNINRNLEGSSTRKKLQ